MAWETIEEAAAPLTLNIEVYEGPLDLLLHLIEKNKIDIADIPIALVTTQYLQYLELMHSLDIGVAGEYLEMAATLMLIKSRMLLPPDSAEEQHGEEAVEDPRGLLRGPLEALKEVKGLAGWLRDRPLLGKDVFSKGASSHPGPHYPQDISLENITLYDLLVTYLGVLERRKIRQPLVLERRGFRIEEQVDRIRQIVASVHQVSFLDLVIEDDRSHVVTLFMAVLELAKEGGIRLVQRKDGELIIINSVGSTRRFQAAQVQT